MLTLIVALDIEHGIGYKNDLPWKKIYKRDLQFFKEMTVGKVVVMGHTTFKSLGSPLANRLNVVFTRDTSKKDYDNVVFFNSFSEADKLINNSKEVVIIGGKSIYEYYIPKVDTMYVTHIKHTHTCDTYLSLPYSKFSINENFYSDKDLVILGYKRIKE